MHSPRWQSDDRAMFARREERFLRRLLPGFAAVFGIGVLAAGIWDWLQDGNQTPSSLFLRLALVALASFAYGEPRSGPAAASRGAAIYLAHAGALATTAGPLADGLRHGMPVLFAWMCCAGLVESRPRQCIRMLAPTAAASALAGALALSPAAALVNAANGAVAIALALLLGAQRRRLRREAWLRECRLLDACRYDNLSGALARGFLTQIAQHDIAMAQRHGRPLAIAMLDLDHFKQVNDQFGHATGDAVIKALVASCTGVLRASDYVGRLGGEEFVCVMPDTGAEQALVCAERMRAAFAALRIPSAPAELRCTVSIGIAVFRGRGDWNALLREADTALYKAKAGGRNRVVPAVAH